MAQVLRRGTRASVLQTRRLLELAAVSLAQGAKQAGHVPTVRRSPHANFRLSPYEASPSRMSLIELNSLALPNELGLVDG